jgi:hypothetical protein
VSAAAFPAGDAADVGDYLGRYRIRYYANGYQLTYEYAVMVEDAGAGMQVEYRVLAAEAMNGDAVALAGVPTWVVTRTADPDPAISEHASMREALAAYRALLAAQGVE